MEGRLLMALLVAETLRNDVLLAVVESMRCCATGNRGDSIHFPPLLLTPLLTHPFASH